LQPSRFVTEESEEVGALAVAERWTGSGFRSLLVCLDRSAAAEAALPLAGYLAGIDQARITLLHVVEPPAEAAEMHATDALESAIARQEARSYLERLSERALDRSLPVDSQVGEGHAAQTVGAMAAELDADLVVLSRSGEGRSAKWTLGGTAQKIIALAHRAVLIVPPDARQPTARVPPRRILVPLDGSLRGESVLPTALRIARASDAEIVIAHAVPDPSGTEVLHTPEDLALARQLADRLTAGAEDYLRRIQAQLTDAGARVATVVCRATDHRQGLVALATGQQIDLVVLSAHGAVCNPECRFGSVTSYIIAHAPAPVLVIQDLPPRVSGGRTTQPTRLPPRAVDAGAGAP
jgi:nucleotide-binding universal stress UspA family protein